MVPVKSVSALMSLESLENSVPRLEIAVSWLCNVVNCVFHGVSTFCKLLTISATVELTLKPGPAGRRSEVQSYCAHRALHPITDAAENQPAAEAD